MRWNGGKDGVTRGKAGLKHLSEGGRRRMPTQAVGLIMRLELCGSMWWQVFRKVAQVIVYW